MLSVNLLDESVSECKWRGGCSSLSPPSNEILDQTPPLLKRNTIEECFSGGGGGNCRLSLFVFNTSGEKPLVAVVLLAACHVTTMLSELT